MTSKNFIICDWGGTNCRAALSTPQGIGNYQYYKCADYADAGALLQTVKEDVAGTAPCEGFVIGIAGPSYNRESFIFPNNQSFGEIDFNAIEKNLSTPIHLINDFAAQAFALLDLTAQDIEAQSKTGADILPKEIFESGNKSSIQIPPAHRFLVIGPGTGLGVCTLLVGSNFATAVDGEGSHINFSPCNAEEDHILHAIRQEHDYVACEMLASGKGFSLIYKALSGESLTPEEVTQKAQAGDPNALKAVHFFTVALGRIAGAVCLINQTRGGVFIPSGSIVCALGPLFDWNLFQSEMAKNDYMNIKENVAHNLALNVPVYLMKREETGMLGAHVYAQNFV